MLKIKQQPKPEEARQVATTERKPSAREAEVYERRDQDTIIGRQRCGGGYRVLRKKIGGN